MLKDPASIALAAFFSFLGISISIYQVCCCPKNGLHRVVCTHTGGVLTSSSVVSRPADTMPPAQLHRASVPGKNLVVQHRDGILISWVASSCANAACWDQNCNARRGTSSGLSSWCLCMPLDPSVHCNGVLEPSTLILCGTGEWLCWFWHTVHDARCTAADVAVCRCVWPSWLSAQAP
jgi:hypothetical protein